MKRALTLVVFLVLAMLARQAAYAIVYGVPDDGHDYVGMFVATVADPDTGEEALFQLCTGP